MAQTISALTVTNENGTETLNIQPSGVQISASEYKNYGMQANQSFPAAATSLLYAGANNRGFYTDQINGIGNVYAAHAIVLSDRLDNGTSDGGDGRPSNGNNTVSALYVEHTCGGSNLRGVRETLNTRTIFDSPSGAHNVNNNYVSQRSNILVNSNDGGTSAAPRGGFFAENPVAVAGANATNLLELGCMEANVGGVQGSSFHIRYGLSSVGFGPVQGSFADAAFATGMMSSTPFTDQFLVSDLHGASPLSPTGNVLNVASKNGGYMSVGTCLNFSGLSSCNNILLAPYTNLQPGGWTLTAPNFGLEVGSLTQSNTPYIDFHSSGSNNDFDARIIASGGNGALGKAFLTLQAGAVQISDIIQPVGNGQQPLGQPGHLWSAVYAASGQIQTSDARLKDNLGVPSAQLLDAIDRIDVIAYRYLDAMADKGRPRARIHAGVIAQQARDAMLAAGLDPARYAFWCEDAVMEDYDEAYEETVPAMETTSYEVEEDQHVGDRIVRRLVTQIREVPLLDRVPIFDESGRPVMTPGRPAVVARDEDGHPVIDPATGYPTVIPASAPEQAYAMRPRMETIRRTRLAKRPKIDPTTGEPETVYSIRYDELSMLMLACARRKIEAMNAQLREMGDALQRT